MKCKDTPYVTMRKNMHKKKNSRPLLLPELEIKKKKGLTTIIIVLISIFFLNFVLNVKHIFFELHSAV